MNSPPDVLLLLSDGHHADYAGFAGNRIVRTPHLDRLAAGGAVFDSAYTPCPLCVPARTSLLTGRLPSQTGVLSNGGVIACDDATYAHTLSTAGYETVLIGRMHFKGDDQQHGFARRLVGDLSPTFWGHNKEMRARLGPMFDALGEKGAIRMVGAGDSPILAYDRDVVRATVDLLGERRRRPLFLVVGFAGPHYPYIAPPELYRYYRDRADVPVNSDLDPAQVHPVAATRRVPFERDRVLAIRAAYFGLVEQLDRGIGSITAAWSDHLTRNDRPGCVVYCADHGDLAGEHDLYGKKSFFEGSARTPLIFNGAGVLGGRRYRGAASLMDVGPTICEMTGAGRLPSENGESLCRRIQDGIEAPDRAVLSELVVRVGRGDSRAVHAGRMVRRAAHKYVTFAGLEEYDELFDLDDDPHEMRNLARTPEHAGLLGHLRQVATSGWQVDALRKHWQRKRQQHRILRKFGESGGGTSAGHWQCPEGSTRTPLVD